MIDEIYRIQYYQILNYLSPEQKKKCIHVKICAIVLVKIILHIRTEKKIVHMKEFVKLFS